MGLKEVEEGVAVMAGELTDARRRIADLEHALRLKEAQAAQLPSEVNKDTVDSAIKLISQVILGKRFTNSHNEPIIGPWVANNVVSALWRAGFMIVKRQLN